jgi:hypothetical protein
VKNVQARLIAKKFRDDPDDRERVRRDCIEWFNKERHTMTEDAIEEIGHLLELTPDQVCPLRERPFRTLVPDGWFKDVLDLVHQSESPSPFYFLAACTVLSHLIGRKVMIDRGTHRLGVDVSALLISPAGRGRRSTACDFIVYDLGITAGAKVFADKFTYEAFGDALLSDEGSDPRMLVYAGEMSTLIGKQSYGESMIPSLTDMLTKTSKVSWGTVKRGYKTIENICVNALMTSSPDWLVDNIPAVAFGGGLMSRLLVCVQDGSEQVVTWGDAIPRESINASVRDLRRLGQTTGTFGRPTGAAFSWYDNWYHEIAKQIERGDLPDERMIPFYARIHDHLLRLTGLLTIAAGDDLEFTVERMEQAWSIIGWTMEDIPKAYASMGLAPIQAAQHAVVAALEKNSGSMDHSSLHRRVYRHAPLAGHFREVMSSLIDLGVVGTTKGMSGRGTVYYIIQTLR